jgi:hypothetical protein
VRRTHATGPSAILVMLLTATSALAQPPGVESPDAPAPPTAQSSPAEEPDPSDEALILAEPDFTLITLPTALRLPVRGAAFRVTHRFSRPLASGDFGDLASDAFGLDTGAVTGLEVRFGLLRSLQAGVHRTSDQTIQFFSEYGLTRQGRRSPLEIAIFAAVEATENFHASKTPTLGVIVSRRIGRRAAFYAEPLWVNNTNPLPKEVVDDNDTVSVGFGARLRVRPSVYVVLEGSPRVRGYKPGATPMGFAIEKHAGGHQFQLNFSNSVGTTMGQIARGSFRSEDWFLGFQISRKFF